MLEVFGETKPPSYSFQQNNNKNKMAALKKHFQNSQKCTKTCDSVAWKQQLDKKASKKVKTDP